MPLQPQEIEIPLNSGMDLEANAELQDGVSSMRVIQNLRFNERGKLEKRPAYTDETTPAASTIPTNTEQVVDNRISTVFARGSEVACLTKHRGVCSVRNGTYTPITGETTSGSTTTTAYEPVGLSMERRFITSYSQSRERAAVASAASAIYNNSVQLVGWVTLDASLYPTYHARAFDLSNGAAITPEFTYEPGVAVSGGLASADAVEISTGGVVSFFLNAGVGNRWVKAVQYTASTNTFGTLTTLTTDAVGICHRLCPNPTTPTRFYLGYSSSAASVLKVEDRTLSTVTSTHTSTRNAVFGLDIVANATGTVVVYGYLNGGTGASTIYAEPFGTPAASQVLYDADVAGGEVLGYGLVAVEQPLTSAAGLLALVGIRDSSNGVYHYNTKVLAASFTSTTVTPDSSPPESNLYNFLPSSGFTQDSRAYAVLVHDNGFGQYAQSSVENTLIVARSTVTKSGSDYVVKWSPIARVGHERAANIYQFARPASCNVESDKVYITYLADYGQAKSIDTTRPSPQTVFCNVLDFSVKPVPWVELNGSTVISGGMLHEYDGSAVFESALYDRPVVYAAQVTAAPAQEISTAFSVRAVWAFTDSNGRLHRSAPSDAVSSGTLVLGDGKQLYIYVTIPRISAFGVHLNRTDISIELYCTAAGGTTYYLATASGVQDFQETEGDMAVFEAVVAGSSSSPSLYTTSGELEANPPPCLSSIAMIGDRLWGINAEAPDEIWFTKPFEAGYAAEWNSTNKLYIGDYGVGISDVNGVPTVFGKRGIWQIYGEGPDATGAGTFAPARRLPHEIDCTSAISVCKTPGGVAFASSQGIMLLDTGLQLQPIGKPVWPAMQQNDSSTTNRWTKLMYDPRHNELRAIRNYSGVTNSALEVPYDAVYVYNLDEGKWTYWSQSVGTTYDGFHQDACVVNGRVWYAHRYDSTTSYLRREKGTDESGYNTSPGMLCSVITPHIKLDGVAGSVRLWKGIFSSIVDVSTDADVYFLVIQGLNDYAKDFDTPSWESQWDSGEIYAIAPTEGVYDFRVQPNTQRIKAVRIKIAWIDNTAVAGITPLSLRLIFGVEPGGFKRFKQGAIKAGS